MRFPRPARWRASGDRFIDHVLRLAGGTALGQVIVVMATPIITRLYTPAEMGVLGVFVSFVGLMAAGAGLRYEMAIVAAADDREADHLLVLSILLAIPVSLLSAAVLLSMIYADLWSYGVLPLWSPIAAAVTLCVTGTFISLRYWVVRRKGFSQLARALVTQGLARAGVIVALGLLNGGWPGLLLGEIAGRVLAIRSLLGGAMSAVRRSIRPFDSRYYAAIARRNWKFPLVVLPASLVSNLGPMLPVPILASLFGAPAAGTFFLAQRLTSLPSNFAAASVEDVLHSRLAGVHPADPLEVRRIMLGVGKRLAMLSLLIYLPLAVMAPFVAAPILGRNWAETGVLAAILTPVFLVDLVVVPLARVFIVADRPEIKLVIDTLRLLPASSLFFWHARGWDFLHSVLAYSALLSLLGVAYLVLIGKLSNRTMWRGEIA